MGLVVFNSTIEVDVDLGLWQGEHVAQTTRKLAAVCAHGGTRLWSAMNHAVQRLTAPASSSTTAPRSKWIVALTDGESGDNGVAPDVARLLSAGTGQTIRVLFITVGLEPQHRSLIEATCVRLRTDHQRNVQGDELFEASGNQESLVQAWRKVGDSLTVSQRIEKQGASLTATEAEKLLRKYMQLDGKHRSWSRLKQLHWVRYLFRRCGILAASEVFNKNRELPKFGSTTMELMLQEVPSSPLLLPELARANLDILRRWSSPLLRTTRWTGTRSTTSSSCTVERRSREMANSKRITSGVCLRQTHKMSMKAGCEGRDFCKG